MSHQIIQSNQHTHSYHSIPRHTSMTASAASTDPFGIHCSRTLCQQLGHRMRKVVLQRNSPWSEGRVHILRPDVYNSENITNTTHLRGLDSIILVTTSSFGRRGLRGVVMVEPRCVLNHRLDLRRSHDRDRATWISDLELLCIPKVSKPDTYNNSKSLRTRP